MKATSAALKAHKAGLLTTMAWCLHIVRADGVEFGLTTAPRDLEIDGLTYKAGMAFRATTVNATDNMSVADLQAEGAQLGTLHVSDIDDADLLAGRWDYASGRLFRVNYRDLSMGRERHLRGWIGRVGTGRLRYTAELRSLAQLLQLPVGEVSSPGCRVALGSARCKVNLAAYTVSGEPVTAVTDRRVFAAAGLAQAAGYFDYGGLTWTTGANAGLTAEVKTYTTGAIELHLPTPFDITVGDEFTIVAGCDGAWTTCRDRFDNLVNFVGEPHKPTHNELVRSV